MRNIEHTVAEVVGLQAGLGAADAHWRSWDARNTQGDDGGDSASVGLQEVVPWLRGSDIVSNGAACGAVQWVWKIRNTAPSPCLRSRAFLLRTRKTVLVVGDGLLAESITRHLQRESTGYRLVGYLTRYEARSNGGNQHVQPSDRDPSTRLDEIVKREGVRYLVVALSERRGGLPIDQLLACRIQGVKIVDGLAFYEEISGKIALAGLRPSYFVFNDGFRWPSRAAKRALDLLLAISGLLITAPLFILLPLLIKAISPGPVFYRQERVGLGGRRFTILKFRSMYENAEQAGRAVWAQESDPRITPVGRFMRKFRLDELPQMLNVLRGDMSFVGPRPERPEFLALLCREIPFYSLRLMVKPGITGWAQVRFRYGATVQDAAEKLQYDLYYIKHMSLLFDSLIALRTIRTVLFQSGAR